MLEIRNIGVKRDDWVLRNIDFIVNKGEKIGIIGKSGAGKTTLLKSIAALIDLTEGEVLLDQKKLMGPAEKLIPGYEDLQLVNQNFALEPFHTVEQNIREKILHLHESLRNDLVEELLDLVELDSLAARKAIDLSGGEQQRLCIARALACEPRVLLLDEPFVHVDQRLRMKLIRYILELNRKYETTLIIVSHDGAELMGLVDRVIHLKSGTVQRIAAAHEMYYDAKSLEEAELMGPVNELMVEGEKILFRPNEYQVKGKGVELSLKRSVDTGLLVFNYFISKKGEEILLTAPVRLSSGIKITIVRNELSQEKY